ncbi:hypothetical protein PLESTF_001042900 [Pleodorina starrii]|nr:hypothetical protein PLESTM_001117200 [Pleodorina starrii]GLC70881.1 hypothetical protein PLESTF_001042900 [Pleodorina starrii]
MQTFNVHRTRTSLRFARARCHVEIRADAEPPSRMQTTLQRARAYYEDVWSKGLVLKLNSLMAEAHEQHDMVWQPKRVATGRSAMMTGIVAYRSAYPDLVFRVQDLSYSDQSHAVFVSWTARGTNLGPIRDQPPTRQVAEFSGITQLVFDDHDQIKASFVYRQAVADEARYFLASPGGQESLGVQPPESSK